MESHRTVPLNFEKFNVHECCQKALASIQGQTKNGVALTFTPNSETCYITSDPSRLHQVLINLLANASKFTQSGEINLSVDNDNAANIIRFSVTDTGKGIPLDKQREIFGRFVKLDTFTQGTGLGLYICMTLVTAMNGRIFVDSSYLTGARFIVEVPINPEC